MKLLKVVAICAIAVLLSSCGASKTATSSEAIQTEASQKVLPYTSDAKEKESFEQGTALNDKDYTELSKYFLNSINEKLNEVSAFGELVSKEESGDTFGYVDSDNRSLIASAGYEEGENLVSITLYIPAELKSKNDDKATAAILKYFGYNGNLKTIFEKIDASAKDGKIVDLDLDETLSLMYGFPSAKDKKLTINIVKSYSK